MLNPDVNVKHNILKILKKHPRGLMIIEIAGLIKHSRQTTAKYLDVLLATEKIKMRKVGTAKLYYLKVRK